MQNQSSKKTAQIAGLLYLILAITAGFGIMYVPSQVFVRNDAATTTINLLSHEFLFRAGVVGHLTSQVLFIFLVMLLYRLFKNINEHQAKLMVALVIVQIPVVFMIESLNISAIWVAKADLMKSISMTERQDFVMFLLKMHHNGILVLEIFYGLWLIPFGQLSYKSGFIPKIFGIMLIVGGVIYIIESLTRILFPDFESIIFDFTPFTYAIAEISMVFWLLIKGVKIV